ncbi:TcdA/TcdB pore-forming domain-containing protein [Pseudomonas sp. AL03]|uniref:TcdA/TcdB pore-forming domain-containing protein n=1 Tax=Pseudomonas sp. AL03 TaxID=3042230 RepID=UPI00249A197B|nr:TcdA/TcdB pore-forming domain-containing protein [Pseudomonas sp. AL03]MDI3272403.1 TcdA/TcdB pore-forming domain-containing protein [Pseudomonas sp. AL03]
MEFVLTRQLNAELQGKALRYYVGAVTASSLSEQLTAVSLLKEMIESTPANASTTQLQQLRATLADYHTRLTTTVELLSTAKAVPKKLHFVWVGGGIGAIQGDYINVWKQMAGPDGYSLNLWYDSDALLAHETHRVIVESAKALGAMSVPEGKADTPAALADRYIERARVLRQQMFEHIQQVTGAGGSADQARIDLLVSAYGQDEQALKALKSRNVQSLEAVERNGILLRDIRTRLSDQPLFDIYEREISFRANLAAASDITRLQVVNLESGTYLDADLLPSLHKKIGGVDLTGFDAEERIGVMQVLLDHNPQILPNRGSHYADLRHQIPEQYREALVDFAKKVSSVRDIFAPFGDVMVSEGGLRVGNKNSPDLAANSIVPFNGLSNALLSGHAGSAAIAGVMEKIRKNYAFLDRVLEQAQIAYVSLQDRQAFTDLIIGEWEKQHGPISDWEGDLRTLNSFLPAVAGYDADGIKFGAQSAIVMSGPSAVSSGLSDFVIHHGVASARQLVSDRVNLFDGFNLATEEETHHSWKDNAKTETAWFELETKKIEEGAYNLRYKGNVNELLEGQTLTLEKGWPVIEGRPVLMTAVLQQLMDDLGEPLIQAMRSKISGEMVLNKPLNLSFDQRQQILAQPVSELPPSLGAEQAANLNELFARLEHGSLPIEQLSPLQRVVLGGLFGVQSLDATGFANAWQDALKLARETAEGGVFARYAMIEKTLHQHKAAAFEAGLAQGGVPGLQTARELKALALTEPMSLNQWGQRIAQVNSTAQREYHTQILKRAAQVREQFFQAGALSARQLPQDLLARTPGDPSRRCYPLTLLMAVALSRGVSAERTLVGRVASASLMPDDTDSRVLMQALDELLGVAMTDAGTPLGTHSLEKILQTLQAKSTTSVLLLDTGNHALLLAKVVVGDSSFYRFFDPNFAVYGFDQVQSLKQGIERYLSHGNAELARLYGLSATPSFNVIELNPAAIADRILPSEVQVGSFLNDGPVASAQTATIWERQAVQRTRSLSENARMGASLAQLDGRFWAREFDEATRRLRSEHELGREFLPLLETVQGSPETGYTLTMVDARNPLDAVKVTTADSRFIKLKKHIRSLLERVAGNNTGPVEADGGSRLSFAFAIQTVITEMRNREYQAGEGQVPALAVALQVQVYVSYAQLGYGVVSDSVQIINLVRQVAASEQALAIRQSSLSGRLLGRASTGVGIGFSVVNIGFDIYGLAVANNQEQRSRLATQLVFDVAALGLDVVALAVGGTVGAAAAILSVPLLGVGIGVTAIASNLGQISDKARAVGEHLRKIQDAYGIAAYTSKDGVLRFEPEAVITHLDLPKKRIGFDSQKFYPMVRGGLELPQPDTNPRQLHRAIDIRQALELPDFVALDPGIPPTRTVVLPCTPICYYGYEYQLGSAGFDYVPKEGESDVEASDLPSGTWYPSLHNSTVSKLEYDEEGERRFYFFANTPFPHILYKLNPVYKPTRIEVTLDAHVRQLLVPELPTNWKKCISYVISGHSGLYQLCLTPGIVAVALRNSTFGESVSWMIRAPWVSEKQVTLENTILTIDGVQVEGFGVLEGFLELANGELFRFDQDQQHWVLLSVTLDTGTNETALPAALARIRERAHEKRLASAYVPLHNDEIPFNDRSAPAYTTGYYDVAQDRVLYARNLPAAANEGIVLGGASGQHAWFYHPDHPTLWRVDATTGTVNHRYRLMNPQSGSTIIGCEQTADGKLRVVQKMKRKRTYDYTLEYLICDQSLTFVGINTWGTFRHDQFFGTDVEDWRDPIDAFGQPHSYADETPGMAASMANWTSAPFICGRMYLWEKFQYSVWIRLHDNQYFRDGIGLTQRIMLMWDQDDNDAMLFYDKERNVLFRGFRDLDELSTFHDEIIESDVVEVSSTAGRYIATKPDGRLFEIEMDSALKFVGVGQRWLEQHPDWLAALPELVKEHSGGPIPIMGLGNGSDSTFLAAWCIDGQLLLADIGHGKELALLGLTPDRQAGWLLDVAAGQIYRQRLIGFEAVRPAFANGARVLHPEHLPVAQKVWSGWSFAEVLTDGQGLRGRTREGVNLELLDNRPARIVSVENQWSYVRGETTEQLQARLKALVSSNAHALVLQVESFPNRYKYFVPELNRVFDVSGRADGQWAVFLGTRNESVPMLFDPVDGLIFGRGTTNGIWLTGSHASRDGEVLVLETTVEVTDLFPLVPDGVDKLILAFGSQVQTYCVSDQTWQRLDCIVIDSRPLREDQPSIVCTLALDMADNQRLLLCVAEGHLVVTDPDNAHSLIVRDADPQDGESRMPLEVSIKLQGHDHRFDLERLLKMLKDSQGDAGSVVLGEMIKKNAASQ